MIKNYETINDPDIHNAIHLYAKCARDHFQNISKNREFLGLNKIDNCFLSNKKLTSFTLCGVMPNYIKIFRDDIQNEVENDIFGMGEAISMLEKEIKW